MRRSRTCAPSLPCPESRFPLGQGWLPGAGSETICGRSRPLLRQLPLAGAALLSCWPWHRGSLHPTCTRAAGIASPGAQPWRAGLQGDFSFPFPTAFASSGEVWDLVLAEFKGGGVERCFYSTFLPLHILGWLGTCLDPDFD